jgi:hypothetical protein
MTWDCEQIFTGNAPLVLPCNFTSQLIAIYTSAVNRRPTWYKFGYLQSFVDVDGELFVGRKFTLPFDRNLIEIPYRNYQLQLQPVDWLIDATIQIRQLPNSQYPILMPNYASLPTTLGDQPVLDSLPTSFTAPQYLLATPPASYQCLAANAARQSFAVTNLGTVPVFLDLDAPSAANKRFIAIAAGGTYVSDFSYVGAVFIWSTTATSQPCEIREFIQ